jgi:hypothetical protein
MAYRLGTSAGHIRRGSGEKEWSGAVIEAHQLIAGHVYRTRRQAFWKILSIDRRQKDTWLVPIKGDPRTQEWQDLAASPDMMTACSAFGALVCKETDAVLATIMEDITHEVVGIVPEYPIQD